MSASQKFNPFSILPKDIILKVLIRTFEKEAKGDFKQFMDYESVSKDLRDVIGDNDNFFGVLDSMPFEFNCNLHNLLRLRKTVTAEGRYGAATAMLFLNTLYSKIKPFPNDEFLTENFDDYHQTLLYIQEKYKEYPSVTYVAGYVAFHLSKRLMTMNSQDSKFQVHGMEIYKIASYCISQANILEHPLAKFLHKDMESQLERSNILISDIKSSEVIRAPDIKLEEVIEFLAEGDTVSITQFSDEEKLTLLVVWQKLLLENLFKSRQLFRLVNKEGILMKASDYFHQCFVINHFHRHVLGYNPFLIHSDCEKTLVYLFKTYSVKALVNLHQGFRVYHPKLDSVLLSTMLASSLEDCRELFDKVNHMLSFPQNNAPGWKMAFSDAYREAVESGFLKTLSIEQLEMSLNYFCLVDRGIGISEILNRESFILSKIMRCKNQVVHQIAIAATKQLLAFNTFDALGHLDHQELLISCVYNDSAALNSLKIKEEKDIKKIAATFIENYKKMIAKDMQLKEKIVVPDFIRQNQSKISALNDATHIQLKELRYY